MKKNILVINMAKGFGGGEVQTLNLMEGLLDNYRIYFYGRKNSPIIKKIRERNLNITMLNDFLLMLKFCVFNNVIIHAEDGRGAHVASILALITNNKLIITRHVNYPLKNYLSIFSYKKADALIGVSKQVCNNLKTLNKNTHLIYAGINPPQENKEFEKDVFCNRTENEMRVCHIGNFQAVKNFELTIKLAKFFNKNNKNIQFYLIGSGELENTLKNIVNKERISNVHFIPKTIYIGSVFKNCDLQIIPSINEGLSLVLLEGYLYNIPTIAHKIGGMAEIIDDKKTGFLIEENNEELYKNILIDIYENREKLSFLKNEIINFNKENDFSIASMVNKHIKLYESFF